MSEYIYTVESKDPAVLAEVCRRVSNFLDTLDEDIGENWGWSGNTPKTGNVTRWSPAEANGIYVIDSIEDRAWGPFDDEDDAEAFLASDKYLMGAANIRDGNPAVGTPIYPPKAYHGSWPIKQYD